MSHLDFHGVLFRAETMFQRNTGKAHDSSRFDQNGNYLVHVWSSWNERASDFAKKVEGQGATLFQSALWLETWYETFTPDPEIEAVIVALEDVRTGQLVMLLPLCCRMEKGLSIICFADFGLADYNAPLIDHDHRPGDQEINGLMHEMCRALPQADLLKLEKIPDFINKTKNPLTSLGGVQNSNLCHYGIEVAGSWDEYWLTLKRNFRKDQRRRWRVLEKKGKVSFVWCRQPIEALELFESLVTQQRKRLQGLDLTYLLDDPRMKQFYEKLIARGCAQGPVIFTALLVDGEAVATLCGLGNGTSFAMTLSGNETADWSKCSPGRLLTERTMQTLHENGYSYFDFTIGDEPYKKYFAQEHGPLLEYYRPLTWTALPRYSWMRVKAAQRHSPTIHRLKQVFQGKKSEH